MFSIKTMLFAGLFCICSIGALFAPHLGIYGYLADYTIGPSKQWWEAPLSGLGIRYSLTLALTTLLGFFLQKSKMRFGSAFFQNQEILVLFFLGAVWFSFLIGDQTVGRYSTTDHPTVKFTKIIIFLFLFTHIITDFKKIDSLIWVLILCSWILGMQAWDLPRRAFVGGRLEGIGGADFSEANFFAAFMASMLPIIGIQFLRSKKLTSRMICFFSAAFTANAVVLCRSRGAFVGIAFGALAAVFMVPREFRKKIILLLVLGVIGGLYVTDHQYLERLTTIVVSEDEERDASANSRLLLWAAGVQMVMDKPMGIGIGNWYQTIGKYIPEYDGKDSHSTYVKCFAELGFQGFIIFSLFIFTAYRQLVWVKRQSEQFDKEKSEDLKLICFGIKISLVIYLACALTITMIYTELTWILLMLPCCVRRALENEVISEKIGE
ncbi:MAG: O-antigen ligase family protein [Desulfobacteraceae bacterium]